MIHDRCDYCFREFGYQPDEPAVCRSCGLENLRPAAPESAMQAPARERAVRVPPRPRGRTRSRVQTSGRSS